MLLVTVALGNGLDIRDDIVLSGLLHVVRVGIDRLNDHLLGIADGGLLLVVADSQVAVSKRYKERVIDRVIVRHCKTCDDLVRRSTLAVDGDISGSGLHLVIPADELVCRVGIALHLDAEGLAFTLNDGDAVSSAVSVSSEVSVPTSSPLSK